MLPSIIFSILYIVIYQDITQPIAQTFYDSVNGVAHMWFLPMLFCCFAVVWLVEKLHLPSKPTLLTLMVVSLLPIPELPLQLHHTFYYLPFFYVGYLLQRKNVSLESINTSVATLISVVAFALLFPSLTLLRENAGHLIGGGAESYSNFNFNNYRK